MINQRKSGALLSYVYIVINALIALVYQPIALRMLGSSEYGLYQLIASVMSYMTVMDLGFGNGIVVYTAKYNALGRSGDVKKLHGMFSAIFCGLGILAAAVGVVMSLFAGDIFSASLTATEISKAKILLLILALNMGLTFPLSIYGNIIIAHERFVFSKFIAILRVTLNPLIMLPILLLGGDSIAMVAIMAAVNIGCLVFDWIYCRAKLNVKVKFCGFDKIIFLEIFSYSIFIFVAEIVDKINWTVDSTILGIVQGTAEVTEYSFASNYNQMVILMSSAIASVMLPKISKMVATNASDKDISGEFIKIGRLQFITVFFIISGFAIFGREFVIWHGDGKCNNAYIVALILMLSAMIPISQTVGNTILKAKNKLKFRTVVITSMALVNIIISVPLAIKFGTIGSAVGTAIALVLANTIIMNIYYCKYAGVDIGGYWKNIFRILPAFILPVVVGIVFKLILSVDAIWKFVAGVVIYTVVFALSVWFVGLNSYDKGLFHSAIAKIKRIKK